MNGVAIVGSTDDSRVDTSILQAQALKVRAGVSCVPDLILSRSGNTAAFILLDQAALPNIPAKELQRYSQRR
jgi:hypothetical protein